MSERSKMLAGNLYDPTDKELVAGRRRARELLRRLNSAIVDEEIRREICTELFGAVKGDDGALHR